MLDVAIGNSIAGHDDFDLGFSCGESWSRNRSKRRQANGSA
ncbi:hypothetical protein BCA52141_I0632 [Brucella canis HSK A52141]|nr:hypothetical protein BCA52141_I0632 [Brucella canis HSK A52141]